jgi:NaMN:DMB phosphoribosyltransferase
MLAVYALMKRMAEYHSMDWRPEQVGVGTTPWVAGDPTGDTMGLAEQLGACLVASRMSFANSFYPQLRAYEQGFVKEGVGAGGCAIAAHLYGGWGNTQLVKAVEDLLEAQLLITTRTFSQDTD